MIQEDLNNDETFENEDELNDETFGDEEEDANWESIQQKSNELEKLKPVEKKPFNLMSFGKPSPNKGFSTNLETMFNLQMDDEEEEEELIIPQGKMTTPQKTKPEPTFGTTPQKTPTRFEGTAPIVGSPSNMIRLGLGSPSSGLIYPQGSTPSKSQDGFKNSKRMLGSEVEFIVRQQLLGCEMSDPYVDDYYYCAMVSKKVTGKSKFPPLSVYGSLVKAEKKEEDRINHERIFGRVPPSNPKAPRSSLQLTDLVQASKVGMYDDKNFIVLKAIETGYDLLNKIEDLVMVEQENVDLFNSQMAKALDKLSSEVVCLIKEHHAKMIQNEKGLKLKQKAVSVLPLLYRQTITSLK